MSDERSGLRRRWIWLAKVFVALVVVAGLAATTRAAMHQWQTQTEELRRRVVDVERQLQSLEIEAPGAERRAAALRVERHRLRHSQPTLQNLRWPYLGVAALLYGVGITSGFPVLRHALRALSQHAPWHVVLAAQIMGHVGKYVPGKAVVVLLRAGALVPFGVTKLSATIAVFIETLALLAVGSVIACTVVWALPMPDWIRWGAVVMAVLATLPTLPPVLGRIAGRLTGTQLQLRGGRGWRLFVAVWWWSLVSWVFIGAAFTMVILAMPHSEPLPALWKLYWIATAATGLAVSIGFVSLLPGGAGIRELVLTSILAPSIGIPHALIASVMLRLLFISVESCAALVASRWLARQRG